MRVCVVAGLMCVAAGALASCGFSQFNSGSDVKDVKDISSIQDDGNGKFNVVCKDGRREQSVTDEAIKRGDVCKPVPTPTPTPVVTQVNPKAFNAFYIWRDGRGVEVLDYPEGYEITTGNTSPAADGVFYEKDEAYWVEDPQTQLSKFIGVPTAGASVAGDLLVYPAQEGRTLKLKFSPESPSWMIHSDAVRYCREKGLRLPTIREIFDFCAAGTAMDLDRHPESRCGKTSQHDVVLWSASVHYNDRDSVWLFIAYSDSDIQNLWGLRDNIHPVRCVGSAE